MILQAYRTKKQKINCLVRTAVVCTCSLKLLIFWIESGIFIGLTTKQLLRRLENEGDILSRDVKAFYKAVRNFYICAADYAIKNLPLSDPILKNAKFVDFSKKDQQCFSQVEYFVARYMYT